MKQPDIDLVVKVVGDTVRKMQSEFATQLTAFEDSIAELRKDVDAKAERGPQGDIGLPGRDGKDGSSGERGERGEKGDPGKDGAPGKKGVSGEKGEIGLPGKDGKDGSDGKDGEQGEPGLQGEPGEKGETGETGLTGEPGIQGERGSTGKDGEQGVQGLRGEKGLPGDAGIPGPQGKDGMPGERGKKGDSGRDGRDGKDGKDGRDGIDGMSGRDALDVEILDSFDPDKSYHKGTWAAHDGGVFRYTGNQWKCILDGIKDIQVSMSDNRTICVTVEKSSGMKEATEFHVSALVYKEVWKAGNYEAGDVVTHDGSMWIALKDTKSKPGQFNKDWRLSVKRGRNGKSE